MIYLYHIKPYELQISDNKETILYICNCHINRYITAYAKYLAMGAMNVKRLVHQYVYKKIYSLLAIKSIYGAKKSYIVMLITMFYLTFRIRPKLGSIACNARLRKVLPAFTTAH